MGQNNLEVALRKGNPGVADGIEPRLDDGAAGDDECVVASHPFTAFLLQFAPATLVERAALRANVGHEKGLLHGLLVPPHVGRRSKVTPVQPCSAVDIGQRTAGNGGVGHENVVALRFTLEMLLSEFVGHAAGQVQLSIEIGGEPEIVDTLCVRHLVANPLRLQDILWARACLFQMSL